MWVYHPATCYSYRSVLGKHPLPGKRPCTAFQVINVVGSVQTYEIYILWALARNTTVCDPVTRFTANLIILQHYVSTLNKVLGLF